MGQRLNTKELLKEIAKKNKYIELIEGQAAAAWLKGNITVKVVSFDTGRRRGKKSVAPSVTLDLSLTSQTDLPLISYGYPGTTLRQGETVSLLGVEFRNRWELKDPL